MNRPRPGATAPLRAPSAPGSVVTVGVFDGVHRGHRDVLARVFARARAAGTRAVLVTFEPHPSIVLKPERAPLLLTPGDEKLEALAAAGVDQVAVLPFTRALAELTAAEFVDRVLLPCVGMRELVIGYDHGFGRDRAGSVEVLQRLGEARGFPVEIVPPHVTSAGTTVSSTAVRSAVAAGMLDEAAELLGRPYSVLGSVVGGLRRGRLLGFPTINVRVAGERKLLPPLGVYAVRAEGPFGRFGGMLNLGPRPTFGDELPSLEAHLFDAAGDFYDAAVRITFVARLRDTRRFDGPDALVHQLRQDAAAARGVLGRLDGDR